MSETPGETTIRLDEIIAEYLAAEESGAAPSPYDVIAANPELTHDLRRFFENRAQMAAAVPGDPPRRQFVPPKVRYFGDYELLDEIARGGMGVVYRAKQTSLNRVVAIKMILSGHLASDEDVKRFHTEAKAAANLNHPGIVPVHEVGVHEGQHYFSMDLIEGRSLAEIVREAPRPTRQTAEYVQAIAEAVEYAHQQGTLHRDLKPSNILIDGDDRVHVTDFGLAVRVNDDSQLTHTGQVLGTPAYMSPEQALGKRGLIGPASDVYSLGVILYELLTGRQPFKGESSAETLRQVMEHDPVLPRTLNAAIPRDLETICLKCLRKEPAKRYATAGSLAEDLRHWLAHEPIQARPVGRAEKLWLWSRRRPAVAGSIAAILLTACVVSGLILQERRRNLHKRVDAAVVAMGTTPAMLVPHAIADLEEFPRELVLSALREKFETAADPERLALAFALAHFGDVRLEFLVAEVDEASPDHVENFIAAVGHHRSEAVAALQAAAERAGDEQDWRHKVRLAMLALHLEAPALATEMCRLRPDPVQRTWFIEECSTWHGDLSRLARLVADSDDGPYRSGVALAAASAPVAEVTPAEQNSWEPVLLNWYATASDSLTHSAAGWALRRWNLDEPTIAPTAAPREEAGWHVNSLGMTMLRIPAGTFVRTDNLSIRVRIHAEAQNVLLTHSFLITDREVTRAQFQEFVDEQQPPEWEGADVRVSPTDQHPVQRVTWHVAVLFCNWLSQREGLMPCYLRTGQTQKTSIGEIEVWQLLPSANGYRLPTEAEWEYACRAGTVTRFCYGDEEFLLDRYAVFASQGTEVSGSRLPNAWGLFDVHGNVQEWCQDWSAPFTQQVAVVDPLGASTGGARSFRGGRYMSYPNTMSSSERGRLGPHYGYSTHGFRVARMDDAASSAFDGSYFQTLIKDLSEIVDLNPTWRLLWELAAMKRFVNDQDGYHAICRRMFDDASQSEDLPSRHALLSTWLCFPEGEEVTEELLEIAQANAERGSSIHKRMLGLAWYRRGEYEQALPFLEQAAAARLSPDSKVVSLLCLAVAQLRLDQLDEARKSITAARTLQENSQSKDDSFNREPWGVFASLWREVEVLLEEKGLSEPIPELPPTYDDWTARASRQVQAELDVDEMR